ncbi:MYG1 family protein [Roseburia faecis]|uniref:MYG1 family protein n=1 Tax=Roseburia faecis TaxID=301302 RepID=UPI003F96A5C9
MKLSEQIKKQDAKAFTHSGKFHADDVFSSALLLYLNPQITITRGNRVPEGYDGIVFDIGRGRYDHHQRDSRVRENGVPYAAFGLLWEELGGEILGGTLAQRFDEEFVQPLDNNDNTGEKNELASLIGNFNPVWDETEAADGLTEEERARGLSVGFLRAVQVAGMVLENKFARYRADARADEKIDQVLAMQETQGGDARILVLPEFVPCQKRLKETDTAFVIFPSNRGGYCIQPQKKPDSMNYKCSFPKRWLGLENEELQEATGLASAGFCHKGGFLMTVGDEADAIRACEISLEEYEQKPVIVCLWDAGEAQETKNCEREETEHLLRQIPDMTDAQICHMTLPSLPDLEVQGMYAEVAMEKEDWKKYMKDFVKQVLEYQPEAVYVTADLFAAYPVVHALRKKHVPILMHTKKEGKTRIVRLPSGS